MIVAVDGPAGAGKSSVCADVCKKMGWTYVNTGILYRAIAYLLDQRALSEPNENELSMVIEDFKNHYRWEPESQSLFYKEENITEKLGTAKMGLMASRVGGLALVREKLLPLQRALSLKSPVGAIVDGRDIGTVVFPDADLKIYMTASLEERARRRMQQLGQGAEFETIKSEIYKRDQKDQGRDAAPLMQAKDALVFDTSKMGVETAVESLTSLIKEKLKILS